MKKNKILVIDPILRGSRLQNTFYFCKALAALYNQVIIVTREDYQSKHLDELGLLKLKNVLLFSVKLNLNGAWIKKLNVSELKIIFEEIIANFPVNRNEKIDIFFTALDDYFISMLFLIGKLRKKNMYNFIFLKYRTEFYYEQPGSFLLQLKYITQKILLDSIVNSYDLFLSMDEKLFENPRIKRALPTNSHFIQEPWEGDFNKDKAEGRKITDIPEKSFVLLTIGKQDKRKGLREVVDAFSKVSTLPNIKLHIVGKIPEELRNEIFDRLNNMPKDSYKLQEDFVPEELLPFYFASTDVVLLPYTIEFKFTSGVLVRAAASGKPIIATSHGLIGHRVKKHNLGLVYDHNDSQGLVESIKEMYNNYDLYKTNILKSGFSFASEGHIDNFINSFDEIISNNIK